MMFDKVFGFKQEVHAPLCHVFDRKALLLLKKKRYQEQLLDKTESQISNLETMVSRQRVTQTPAEPQRLSFLVISGPRSGVCSD